MKSEDDGPNPPMLVGAPQPPPSLREVTAFRAEQGTLESLRWETGYYFGKATAEDLEEYRRRSRGMGR